MAKDMNFRSMEEFWLFYMNQHSKPATRRWHFAGTLGSILCLIYSVLFNWWFLFFVPVVGYGMAWYSHFFIEGNVPATFGHPFWSLLCDYKMFGLMLTGQMDREIKRLGKRPILQPFIRGGESSGDLRSRVLVAVCDYKMFWCLLTGQMDREIKRLGPRPVQQAL